MAVCVMCHRHVPPRTISTDGLCTACLRETVDGPESQGRSEDTGSKLLCTECGGRMEIRSDQTYVHYDPSEGPPPRREDLPVALYCARCNITRFEMWGEIKNELA